MRYDYVPLPDRKPLRWPNGARVALILTINLEHWDMVKDSDEPYYAGGPPILPDPMPGNVVDWPNYSWREYGQRVGVWRVIEAFDKAGVPASCTVNGLYLKERRRAIDAVKERGWELVPHNWAQNDILTYYAHDPEGEREVIHRTLSMYEDVVGKPAKGWLSSSLRPTERTVDVLREAGLIFFCDFLNDDQPYLIHTGAGEMVCVPYSNDVNDFNMFARGGMTLDQGLAALHEQFNRLYQEGGESMRIMNLGLHPHVIGQPYRIRALEEFLAYATSFDDVWFPKREEIAEWYLENHRDHI